MTELKTRGTLKNVLKFPTACVQICHWRDWSFFRIICFVWF